MTNEEKAKELADYYAGETDYLKTAAYSAAMGMAEWKDKQFAAEKAALIDRIVDKFKFEDFTFFDINGDVVFYYDDFSKFLEEISKGKLTE